MNSYDQKLQDECSRSQTSLSEIGPIKEDLNLSKLSVDTEDIVLSQSKNVITNHDSLKQNIPSLSNSNQKKTFVMHESQAQGKKKIWKDRLTYSEKNILTIELSKMLDQDSTSREKDFQPFWTQQSKEISETLWLPTKIDCVDSVLSSSKSSLMNTPLGKSWFSIEQKHPLKKNSLMTSFQSSQYSLPESMDFEAIQSKKQSKKQQEHRQVKTLKVRLFPLDQEEKKMIEMEGHSRWYYNAAKDIKNEYNKRQNENKEQKIIDEMTDEIFSEITEEEKEVIDEITDEIFKEKEKCIRDLTREYVLVEELKDDIKVRTFKHIEGRNELLVPNWCSREEIYERVARGAFEQFESALKGNITKIMSGAISCFEMKCKTKKDQIQTIHFTDYQVPPLFKKIKSRYTYSIKGEHPEKRRKTMTLSDIMKSNPKSSGFTIVHDTILGTWYAHCPIISSWYPSDDRRNESQVTTINEDDKQRIISLDPGVRKFMLGYDPRGSMSFIGEGAQNDLMDILEVIDGNVSKISTEKNIDEKKKLKFLNSTLRKKVKNMVEDLHYKTIRFLMLNYDVILLPDFRISGMVKKNNISSRTKRMLYMFSFFTFKQRLIYACEYYKKTLCIVDESFTSKTCCRCGVLNDVKGKEVYHCLSCALKIDRDCNGARNIFIKNISVCD